MKIVHSLPILLLALASLQAPASAQDFKKLIEQGRYQELAEKTEAYLELDESDPKLRAYLEMNLAYLERGGKPRVPGSEIILVRGAKNDRLYQMPNAAGKKRKDDHPGLFAEPDAYPSGGPRLMLPNRIRYLHMGWDKRLAYFDRYFREATDLLGGDGDTLRELDRIIEHHKGGGLGTHANSVKSVLISTSTRPLWAFGPPYYIIKIAPERCIFNVKGLSKEVEVLVPFWILPHEIVARCDSMDEVLNHPVYKQSTLKDISFHGPGGFGTESNWAKIERNIRNGSPPLPLEQEGGVTGVVEVSGSRLSVRDDAGHSFRITDSATRRQLERFEGKQVRLRGEATEVDADDSDLEVEEVLSPRETTLTAEVIADGALRTAAGHDISVEGAIARALPLAVGEVTVAGWLFSEADETPTLMVLTSLEVETKDEVRLRRPTTVKVPPGTSLRVSYVSKTGRSAIVRNADGAWGWVRTKHLVVGQATVGLVGSIPTGP